ncbi:YeeE/YedE thiosulfate transporter family protein [Rhodoferax sediminis]|uniref:Uncharacterized protein n=1 Tax=Rhodoferax sediminis TaxID=2509614 RepID=A0A515D7Q1_9BURK|nr:YeeE/YedE thiosulfate transporter family protein [Rhodoferax sediminis]QDL36426.1 hypothetical protein EUB48_03265 [Rhodoferax sediminis]
MSLEIVTLACALLIGFAAHRASLRNVRAISEVITAGSMHLLWSPLQAMLWTATLTGVLVLGFGMTPQPAWARTPLALAWAGGLLFGVGAALNGGCSLSTLTRLADGDLGILATLGGFLVGVRTWIGLQATGLPAGLAAVVSPWSRWPQLAPWLLALFLAWAFHRLKVLWQLSRGRHQLKAALLAPTFHLSIPAALLGLAAGLLYARQGAWSYTNYLRTRVLNSWGAAPAPSTWHGLLVLGLPAGMIAFDAATRLVRLAPAERCLELAAARWRRRTDGIGCNHGAGRK